MAWRKKKESGLVQARNGFLIMAALMERPTGITTIVLGLHSNTNYIDCSIEFVDMMEVLVQFYSDNKVRVATPFLSWSKSEILKYAEELKIPLKKTYSCEVGGVVPCGNCLSCIDRNKANES